ncbi:MAG: phenylacetate--CoA ligase family protein [Chloroflexota bacterium]
MIARRGLLDFAWDIWRTSHGGQFAVAARQQSRLTDLIEFARRHSPFYRKLYHQLPVDTRDVRRLPPVTKPELMANFDDWVTDPAVTQAGVEAFVADKTLVGRLYLGRYAVWTTSGVTGKPGIFVHDGEALAVYDALVVVRFWLASLTAGRLWAMLRRGGRVATVVATGGHFTGFATMERARRLYPALFDIIRTFSVLTPLAELVQALNNFQPALLVGYPTAMTLLAQEQAAGRLKINPVLVATAAEWLAPAARRQIEATFNCPVRDTYAASEFMGIAFECGHGWLHVAGDWVILEPVDEAYRPVPPGQASHTTLLTNLANRVQPVLRYDLGDSITMSPEPCPCGSPLPAIRVEGRRDEILYLPAPGGDAIPLLPLALATVVEETPGVGRFQVIQTAPATLSVRLEVIPGTESTQVWETVALRLRDYLSAQGLPSVDVKLAPEPPSRDPASGKFRQVWADLGAMERRFRVHHRGEEGR